MNNQEAIEWFRTKYAKVICDDCETPVGMAISALQAQDGTDTNVGSMISRQAAIDEWKNDFKGYVNALNIPRDDYNGIMAYIDELPSAQPEPHWIPCSERLPEKYGEMYLVTISDGSVYSFALQWDINRKRWYLSFLNNGEILIEYIDDVIAWMPLPEPYRVERRTDNANVDT